MRCLSMRGIGVLWVLAASSSSAADDTAPAPVTQEVTSVDEMPSQPRDAQPTPPRPWLDRHRYLTMAEARLEVRQDRAVIHATRLWGGMLSQAIEIRATTGAERPCAGLSDGQYVLVAGVPQRRAKGPDLLLVPEGGCIDANRANGMLAALGPGVVPVDVK